MKLTMQVLLLTAVWCFLALTANGQMPGTMVFEIAKADGRSRVALATDPISGSPRIAYYGRGARTVEIYIPEKGITVVDSTRFTGPNLSPIALQTTTGTEELRLIYQKLLTRSVRSAISVFATMTSDTVWQKDLSALGVLGSGSMASYSIVGSNPSIGWVPRFDRNFYVANRSNGIWTQNLLGSSGARYGLLVPTPDDDNGYFWGETTYGGRGQLFSLQVDRTAGPVPFNFFHRWEKELGPYFALAFNPKGVPTVVAQVHEKGTNLYPYGRWWLKYYSYNAGNESWQEEVISGCCPNTYGIGLVFNPYSLQPAVAFTGNGNMKLAIRDTLGKWRPVTIVARRGVGNFCSLGQDNRGTYYLAYVRYGYLQLATNLPSTTW